MDAKVLVCGEAYGAKEAMVGQPFVGPSGALLEGMLHSVGIDPASCRFTNLRNSRPPGNKIRAWVDSTGSPLAPLTQGLIELREEIEQVNPNLILALGNYPLAFLAGKATWKKVAESGGLDYSGISDHRGSIWPGTPLAGGRKVMAALHPASILRNYATKPYTKLDLKRAAEQARFPEIRRPAKTIIIDPQGTDRQDWIKWLLGSTQAWDWPQSPFLTVDIEYIGSKLLCCGLTRHSDVAVVLRTDTIEAVEELKDILMSGIPLCFQNGMFDCSILEWWYNIPCVQHLLHDTMVGMHCAYTEFPKDLGFITSIFTEQPYYKDAIDWKKIKAGTQSMEEVWTYNATDVWVTHSAMEQMLGDELQDPAVLREYKYEMSLIPPLWEISKRGVRVDGAAMQALRAQLDSELEAIQYGLESMNGGPFNPNSKPQCAEFLYGTLGIGARGGKTKTGKWKMDDTTLAELLPLCQTDRQRLGIRMLRKASERSALISKFCEIDLDDDGRMRCHYDPAKTDTSRLSSRKFYPTGRGANLQNIPRDSRVRAVFTADAGMFFGNADLKSAESLVVAHITGDREMLRLHSGEYMAGKLDGHKYVAAFLLGKPIESLTDDERYLGKRVRHAGNYGLSWKKLQKMVNKDAEKTGVSITAAQSKKLIEKYRQFHPGLKGWWDDVMMQLTRNHTIWTQMGRKRVFYNRPEACLPDAIAFNPQGTVAKALNIGLLRAVHDPELQGLGFQVLLQVHDSISYQGPLGSEDAINLRLEELMRVEVPIARRGVDPYTITIPVEIKTGSNFGDYHADTNPLGLRRWKAGSAQPAGIR
jgi:uracil-DNA glycosylase family 4